MTVIVCIVSIIAIVFLGFIGLSIMALMKVSKLTPEEEAKLEDYLNERGKARIENTQPMTKNDGPAAENERKSD